MFQLFGSHCLFVLMRVVIETLKCSVRYEYVMIWKCQALKLVNQRALPFQRQQFQNLRCSSIYFWQDFCSYTPTYCIFIIFYLMHNWYLLFCYVPLFLFIAEVSCLTNDLRQTLSLFISSLIDSELNDYLLAALHG